MDPDKVYLLKLALGERRFNLLTEQANQSDAGVFSALREVLFDITDEQDERAARAAWAFLLVAYCATLADTLDEDPDDIDQEDYELYARAVTATRRMAARSATSNPHLQALAMSVSSEESPRIEVDDAINAANWELKDLKDLRAEEIKGLLRTKTETEQAPACSDVGDQKIIGRPSRHVDRRSQHWIVAEVLSRFEGREWTPKEVDDECRRAKKPVSNVSRTLKEMLDIDEFKGVLSRKKQGRKVIYRWTRMSES